MEYVVIQTGPLAENCYLLTHAGKVWIIDPGADAEEIIAEVEARGVEPVAILLTHGHFDHIGALDTLLKKWETLPVILRAEDAEWAFTHPINQYPPFYFHQQRPDTLLSDIGEAYTCGGITAQLIHTPGHTKGGQCILVHRDEGAPLCFTGDTLFKGSIGRTDLPGGSFGELNTSLQHLKQSLTPETTILSGHGDASTMESELRYNPYLQDMPEF